MDLVPHAQSENERVVKLILDIFGQYPLEYLMMHVVYSSVFY